MNTTPAGCDVVVHTTSNATRPTISASADSKSWVGIRRTPMRRSEDKRCFSPQPRTTTTPDIP